MGLEVISHKQKLPSVLLITRKEYKIQIFLESVWIKVWEYNQKWHFLNRKLTIISLFSGKIYRIIYLLNQYEETYNSLTPIVSFCKPAVASHNDLENYVEWPPFFLCFATGRWDVWYMLSNSLFNFKFAPAKPK